MAMTTTWTMVAGMRESTSFLKAFMLVFMTLWHPGLHIWGRPEKKSPLYIYGGKGQRYNLYIY